MGIRQGPGPGGRKLLLGGLFQFSSPDRRTSIFLIGIALLLNRDGILQLAGMEMERDGRDMFPVAPRNRGPVFLCSFLLQPKRTRTHGPNQLHLRCHRAEVDGPLACRLLPGRRVEFRYLAAHGIRDVTH